MTQSDWGLRDAWARATNATIAAFVQSGETLQNAKMNAANGVLSQSYLRLEQPLLTTSNKINFPVLNQASAQNLQRATEVRLRQQDSFFVSSIAVYIALAASATDTAFRLETFPNVNIFPTGAAGLETVAPLNTFYNGYLELIINKTTIVPYLALSDHLQVPQTQRVSTTAGLAQNQFDPSQCGILVPNWNLIGTKDNVLNIIMPSILSAVDANTYVAIVMKGVLAQNVTVVS